MMTQKRLPPPTPDEIVSVRLRQFNAGYSVYTRKKLTAHCKDILLKDVQLIVSEQKHYEWRQNPLKNPKEYLHLSFAGRVVSASDEPIDLPGNLIDKFVELEYNAELAPSFIVREGKEIKKVTRARFVYLTDTNFFAISPR